MALLQKELALLPHEENKASRSETAPAEDHLLEITAESTCPFCQPEALPGFHVVAFIQEPTTTSCPINLVAFTS